MRFPEKSPIIVAFSGGADSVYLADRLMRRQNILLAHFNQRARGLESERDEEFCRKFADDNGLPIRIGRSAGKARRAHEGGFEEKAREERRRFLLDLMEESGAAAIATAHHADDQIETILMRFLEGSGLAGLKGIPEKTPDGFSRPILDCWKKDIVKHIRNRNLPFRLDRSNFDTRHERNWIRHILIPLLVKRYGEPVKRRIRVFGERMRELDAYVESEAINWLKSKLMNPASNVCFARKDFSVLPEFVRIRILQRICFDRLGVSANERLLKSMDRVIASGAASARLDVGRGVVLRCCYQDIVFERSGSGPGGPVGGSTGKIEEVTIPLRREKQGEIASKINKGNIKVPIPCRGRSGKPAVKAPVRLAWEVKGKWTGAQARGLASDEKAASFDAASLALPLRVRPLRAGDRIRPFGLDADKKVKEILINRKVPSGERWGRPVVCDGTGTILWIPGVVRASHAPVTGSTKRAVVLRLTRSA